MTESIDKSPVLNLHEALGRQDRGIVSRILLKKPSGNLTLFAFDEGQELSEHTSPYEALIQVFDGEADVTIAGQTHRLRANDTIVLPANVPHAVKAPQAFKMLLTMFRS